MLVLRMLVLLLLMLLLMPVRFRLLHLRIPSVFLTPCKYCSGKQLVPNSICGGTWL